MWRQFIAFVNNPQAAKQDDCARYLIHLKRNQIPLLVRQSRVPDEQTMSTILTVDIKKRCFKIDPLSAWLNPQGALPATDLSFETNLEGVPLSFYVHSLETIKENGDWCHQCAFPHTIDYQQRRRNYRMHLPDTFNVQLQLHHPGLGLLTGKVLNLSISGAKTHFPGNLKEALPYLKQFPCQLMLDEHGPFKINIENRYCYYDLSSIN